VAIFEVFTTLYTTSKPGIAAFSFLISSSVTLVCQTLHSLQILQARQLFQPRHR